MAPAGDRFDTNGAILGWPSVGTGAGPSSASDLNIQGLGDCVKNEDTPGGRSGLTAGHVMFYKNTLKTLLNDPPFPLFRTPHNSYGVMLMRSHHPMIRSVACLLIFVFCYFNVLWAPAQAALVSTDQAVEGIADEHTRARLHALLARADVKAQLEAWGVDPLEAQARVDTLTAEELETLSAQMNELPAGGSGLAVVAVVLLIAFLVILLTDIMGYTNIFTFTR